MRPAKKRFYIGKYGCQRYCTSRLKACFLKTLLFNYHTNNHRIKNILMNRLYTLTAVVILFLIASCQTNNTNNAVPAHPQDSILFGKGNKITNNNFTGTAWLNMLVESDTVLNTSIGNVTFEPKARTNWHYHENGQILLATDGLGYYQEKGKPLQLLQKGDIIKCSPDIEHWHGASPNSYFSHIAIGPSTHKGSVVWLQPVTDEEYNSLEK